MSKETMKIWDALYETDENYIKEVNFGRKFNAIDPYYQIKKITEVFGPAGFGWWYETELLSGFNEEDPLVVVKVKFYYRLPENREQISAPIEVITSAKRMGKENKIDIDAYKKATTDALTKAFSIVGCDAGVFMGEYDNNKYVQREGSKAQDSGEPASEAQVKYLDKLSKNWKELAKSKDMIPGKLTKIQASALIEILKSSK
jgi:hypothetical protein